MTPLCSGVTDLQDQPDSLVYQLAAGHGKGTHHSGTAAVRGKQHTCCAALAHRGGHGGGDFPKHGVRQDNANRPCDDVGLPALHNHSVFSRSALNSACADHATGSQCICADSNKRMLLGQTRLEQALDDLRAQTAALAVNDKDSQGVIPPL